MLLTSSKGLDMNINERIATLTKELATREAAAAHLTGIPAQQNMTAINRLYDVLTGMHIKRIEEQAARCVDVVFERRDEDGRNIWTAFGATERGAFALAMVHDGPTLADGALVIRGGFDDVVRIAGELEDGGYSTHV